MSTSAAIRKSAAFDDLLLQIVDELALEPTSQSLVDAPIPREAPPAPAPEVTTAPAAAAPETRSQRRTFLLGAALTACIGVIGFFAGSGLPNAPLANPAIAAAADVEAEAPPAPVDMPDAAEPLAPPPVTPEVSPEPPAPEPPVAVVTPEPEPEPTKKPRKPRKPRTPKPKPPKPVSFDEL